MPACRCEHLPERHCAACKAGLLSGTFLSGFCYLYCLTRAVLPELCVRLSVPSKHLLLQRQLHLPDPSAGWSPCPVGDLAGSSCWSVHSMHVQKPTGTVCTNGGSCTPNAVDTQRCVSICARFAGQTCRCSVLPERELFLSTGRRRLVSSLLHGRPQRPPVLPTRPGLADAPFPKRHHHHRVPQCGASCVHACLSHD